MLEDHMKNRRWTLRFDGGLKVFLLREQRWTGEKWHTQSEYEWSTLTAALDHIRKVENDAEWT